MVHSYNNTVIHSTSHSLGCALCLCRWTATMQSELQGQLYILQAVTQLTDFWVSPLWDSPSATCYLTNQWIPYNLPIDLINAQILSEAILTSSRIFSSWDSSSALCYLTNKWLDYNLLIEVGQFISLPFTCDYWLHMFTACSPRYN